MIFNACNSSHIMFSANSHNIPSTKSNKFDDIWNAKFAVIKRSQHKFSLAAFYYGYRYKIGNIPYKLTDFTLNCR